MAYGPVEMLAVKFPGNKFTGEIAPALEELVDSGMIRIIDLLFVLKDEKGEVFVYEMNAFGDEVAAVLEPMVQQDDELLSQSDAESIALLLEPNSSAALLLFENTWATRFVTALANADGELLVNARIPRAVIDEILAETA